MSKLQKVVNLVVLALINLVFMVVLLVVLATVNSFRTPIAAVLVVAEFWQMMVCLGAIGYALSDEDGGDNNDDE